ncbi:hypothetical protein [Kribbella sp. NPDC051620]|uniref:hypothetical protein n=1 Tax=Kribbella sp. NPDC051620 TaxID=3364120 RepID=UPI003789E873
MSLAKQFQNRLERDAEGEPSDVLRFTVLCPTPGDLAAAARSTVDKLQASGWAVQSAIHSERAAARALCVELSDTLATPPGLDDLRTLGGVPVEVNNYSDSRNRRAPFEGHPSSTTIDRHSQRQQATGRQIDGTGR